MLYSYASSKRIQTDVTNVDESNKHRDSYQPELNMEEPHAWKKGDDTMTTGGGSIFRRKSPSKPIQNLMTGYSKTA